MRVSYEVEEDFDIGDEDDLEELSSPKGGLATEEKGAGVADEVVVRESAVVGVVAKEGEAAVTRAEEGDKVEDADGDDVENDEADEADEVDEVDEVRQAARVRKSFPNLFGSAPTQLEASEGTEGVEAATRQLSSSLPTRPPPPPTPPPRRRTYTPNPPPPSTPPPPRAKAGSSGSTDALRASSHASRPPAYSDPEIVKLAKVRSEGREPTK